MPKLTISPGQKWFTILLAITAILGVFFRLAHLGHQLYWHDEAYTLFRTAGYTGREINQLLFDGQIHSLNDVLQYQRLRPESTWLDTVRSLALEDAQHPPIYYLSARIWMSVFGDSIAVIRSLSALASLLILPCLYLLSQLIFRSSLTGWMTITLFAISPLQVMYAQEAREYALWSLTVFLSSIALLVAWRHNNFIAWAFYTVSLILSLYTFSLSGLVMGGYIIYAFTRENCRLTKKVLFCFISSAVAIAAFLPWLVFAVKSWSETGAVWSSIPIPLITLIRIWGLHVVQPFILLFENFNFSENFDFYTFSSFLILAFCLTLIGFSFHQMVTHLPKSSWLLPIILTASTFLPLALLDLTLGGQRSTATRYLIPTFLGVQLTVGFALAIGMSAKNNLKRKIAQGVYAIVITTGIISCAFNFQSPTAWTKGISYNLYQVAESINQEQNSLIVSNSKGINFGNILALTYLLKKDVNFLLVDGWQKQDYETEINIPPTYKNIFILGLSQQLRKELKQKYNAQLELIFNDSHLWLWKLKKIN